MKRPDNEPYTIEREEDHFYTRLTVWAPGQASAKKKWVYFFADKRKPGGLYRYETPLEDSQNWSLVTALEKLSKLPILEQQTVQWPLVANLIKAIQLRHQHNPSAREYDIPRCHHTRRSVEKWIEGMLIKYGD